MDNESRHASPAQDDRGDFPRGSEQQTAQPDPRERYEREIDLDSDSTHARVVRLVGSDRRVLEIGPAAGHMSRVLQDRGCSVVGIELDPEMAASAAPYCERVIVGDLDTLDLEAELGSDRFDVIVAADVLEHLKDPLAALQRVRGFLASDGFFVISLPNVAHGSVRLALLEGHFAYQRIGLLDRTHLRFFTRESIDELLDESELGAAEIYHQELNIDASEVTFDPDGVPAEVLQALKLDPNARTYQFVIKAIPFEVSGMRELQRRMRELAHENARFREAEKETAARLLAAETVKDTLAAAGIREAQLRGALIRAHDQMLSRDEQMQRLQEEIDDLRRGNEAARAETAGQREEALRLRVRLERILTSPPARAYAKLGQLPGVKGLVAVRTAGYQNALRGAKASEVPAPERPHG
jgi:2-polyprenyl-3-methyl-5-hydroxy-6-metoxy-1,4-benzoquinol methylase